MDMFDFFTKNIEIIMFIFYSLCLSIGSYFLGHMLGEMNSLRDNFKSLDYDNLVRENRQLKDVIEIKNKVRLK